jgi:translation initiation factor 2B subunit (eIF-2B alpha/beta/delta family)
MLKLKDIEQIHQTMLKLAQEGDWETLHKESSRRHKLIELYLEQEKNNISMENAQKLMHSIRSTDQAITEIMETQKSYSVRSGLQLQNAYKAIKQYQDHSKSQ